MLAWTRNTHWLNKVQSDFRVWDLQINPAWVSWWPGSGINCYISWPSSCCLSQPAWLGPGLARNHGLRAQQCGHFPRRRNTGFGGLLSKQDEPCQTLLAPTFHNRFLYHHFSFFCSGPSVEIGEASRQFWVECEAETYADLWWDLVLGKAREAVGNYLQMPRFSFQSGCEVNVKQFLKTFPLF